MLKGQYGDQYTEFLNYVRTRSTVRAADIGNHFGLDYENASAILSRALRRGHVERVDRGEYRATRD